MCVHVCMYVAHARACAQTHAHTHESGQHGIQMQAKLVSGLLDSGMQNT